MVTLKELILWVSTRQLSCAIGFLCISINLLGLRMWFPPLLCQSCNFFLISAWPSWLELKLYEHERTVWHLGISLVWLTSSRERRASKPETPTLVDVMITNIGKCFSGRNNVDFGCSDFHNLIAVASRTYTPQIPTRKITYQNMKRSRYQSFLEPIETVPVHVSEIFDDIDDGHWARNNLLMSIIGHHAEFKSNL